MTDTVKETIRRFVLKHTDDLPVDDDEDLFEAGYVNSLFAVQLVVWLERTFGVAARRDELMLDNLRSVTAITAYVAARIPNPKDTVWTSS